MSRDARALRPRRTAPRWRLGRRVAAPLALTVVLVACGTGSGGGVDEVRDDRDAPNPGAIPTIAGGVELPALDPGTVLVGSELTFGAPLPSEQAAADAFTADPEVSAALARRAHATDGRRLADVIVLALDGTQLFDESVLAAFERGAVGALAEAVAEDGTLAGRAVLRATGADGRLAVGFREGNLLTIVRGSVVTEVDHVVTRQLEALARGEVGSTAPVTPLVAVPTDAAFVAVPTVTFVPFPAPEEEPPPPVPALPGATGVAGRYGVVAGERRTVVWSFAVAGGFPSAEALEPAVQALVSQLAAGAPAEGVEVLDRVVHRAVTSTEGTSQAASAFRHQGLVLVVAGTDAAQVDAVATAWITALGPT